MVLARFALRRVALVAVAGLLFASFTVAVSAYSPSRIWLITNADGVDHVVRVETGEVDRTLIVAAGQTTKLVADNGVGEVLVVAFREPCLRSGRLVASRRFAHLTIEPGGQLTLRDPRYDARAATPAQGIDECSGS